MGLYRIAILLMAHEITNRLAREIILRSGRINRAGVIGTLRLNYSSPVIVKTGCP